MTTAATTSPALTDDRQARRNALLLAAAQALYSSNSVIIITTGGLIGSMLAPSPVWATVPVSAFVVGTATSTVPASLLMGRVGRMGTQSPKSNAFFGDDERRFVNGVLDRLGRDIRAGEFSA